MLQNITTMKIKSVLTPLFGLLPLCSLAASAEYRVETLPPTSALHGANGMHFDADGRLIVGSMMGGTISKVNIETGAVETIVPSPLGIADDLAIGPDGQLVWTTMPMGIVHTLDSAGKVRKIATGLPLINSVYFTRDGRLFAAQVTETVGDLFELDPTGTEPPKVVMKDLQGLNGFDINNDDILFAPLMNAGKVVRIDLKTMELTEIADGFTRPSAVNLDSAGQIYVVDLVTGEVIRVDPETGAKTLIAQRVPPIDNLAISADDLIYVSHPCSDGIEEINPATGAVRAGCRRFHRPPRRRYSDGNRRPGYAGHPRDALSKPHRHEDGRRHPVAASWRHYLGFVAGLEGRCCCPVEFRLWADPMVECPHR